MATLQVLTLEELKRQLRVDFEEDDAFILEKGAQAEAAAFTYTRRSKEELIEENKKRTLRADAGFPVEVKGAMLMYAAHFYENPSPVVGRAQVVVPYGLETLLKPWTKLFDV